MEERKNLFESIREVISEIEHLQNENKCLKEEINNREIARIECDSYVRKLVKERNELLEKIDDKEVVMESWVDLYNASCESNKRLKYENRRLYEEIEAMVKDHEVECEDYCATISERVNIDDLHVILAKYLTDNYTPEPAKICFFQFLDEIKKFIDSNKKEC